MAKLGGKADPTIVKMAYAEALGNVPLDESKNYQKIVEAHEGFMKDIKTQAKNYKAMRAIDELAFEKAMSVFDDPLAAQVVDSDHDMMYTEVEAQRQAWEDNNGFKNNDKELANWNRKNNQIIQKYQSNQQNLIDVKTGVDGKIYDIKSMPKSELNFMTNIANYQANKNNKSGVYNKQATEYMKNNPEATMEDLWNNLSVKEEGAVVKYHDPATGEYTYVSKVTDKYGEEMVVSSKSSDLKSKFDKYRKADNSLLEAEKLYEKVHKNALQTEKGWGTFKNQYMNHLEKIIDNGTEENENTLGYLMGKKIGGQEKSFAEALQDGDVNSAEIISSLSLNNDGYKGDVNKDGKLDEGDFTSVENYQKVVDAILSGELDKTSPGTTKEMYLDYMDTQFEKEHNLRKKALPSDGKTTDGKIDFYSKGKGVQLLNGAYLSGGQAESLYFDIQNGNKFTAQDPVTKEINDYSYHIVDSVGGWYQNYQEGDTPATEESYIGPTAVDIAKVFTNDSRFINLETKTQKTVNLKGEDPEFTAQEELYKNILSDLDVGDDDDTASEKLNLRFGLTGSRDNPWMFMPYSGTATKNVLKKEGGTSLLSPDAGYTSDIMIYNSRTGDVIESGGKRMRFKIGNNADNTEVARILKVLKDNNIYTPGQVGVDPTVGMTPAEKIQYYTNNPNQ